jgi:hypothetical protein
LTAIFHGVQSEVDLWHRLLGLNRPQSIVDLTSVLDPRRERVSLILTVHGREGIANQEFLS